MEISSRRSQSLNLDTAISLPTSSSYPLTYGSCCTNMHTTQGIKSSPEVEVQKAYRMTNSLSLDSSMKSVTTQKKENFFTSMFGALTNIVIEHLGKVPSTFMSNIHNTLSVTVVPNEGIISHEFFKNLTQSCEQLAIEQNRETVENPMNKLSTKSMYDVTSSISQIFTDKTTNLCLPTKASLNFELSTNMECETNENFNDIKSPGCPIVSMEIFKELSVRIGSEYGHKSKSLICNEMKQQISKESENSEIISSNLEDSTIKDSTAERMKRKTNRPSSSDLTEFSKNQSGTAVLDEPCTKGWHAMWRKVVNGMSERFNASRALSPDSEVPKKKPNLSKPHRRKTCTIAHGRGKGRGKSQLRRNGVSQSRHRKERTKQNIYCNIQDDLNAWKDSECYDGTEDDESSINERTIDQEDSYDTTDSINPSPHNCSTLFDSMAFDVSSIARQRKQKSPNASSKCPMRLRYIPESSMDIETRDSSYDIDTECPSKSRDYRPRLLSESSVDSDDSYCIVFEKGSECTDYDYDAASDGTSDVLSDEDFDDDDKPTVTVRFNLEPQVHTMIKWDYAYRAARRGPWEEMARDRERFRGRIKCVEKILSPILSMQHRNHIWQKRFNIDDGSEHTAQAFI